MSDDVLVEHRAAAELTARDVDDLSVFGRLLRLATDAPVDGQLDRAAAALAALVSVLPPRHVIVVALRSGLQVAEERRAAAARMKEVSLAVASDPRWRGYWSRWVSFEEIQRRRAVPGPMAVR